MDERGAGDVLVDMFGTEVVRNGEFDPEDLDDGFDIDEYNDGSVIGVVASSVASDNYEEGLDFNENNAGDLRVDLVHVEANGNREEGVDYEEDDDFAGGGDLVTVMTDVTTNGNGADGGDAGLKIREKGVGRSRRDVERDRGVRTTSSAAISVREDADGEPALGASNARRPSATPGAASTSTRTRAGDLTARGGRLDVADQRATWTCARISRHPAPGASLLSDVTYATSGGNTPPTIAD